MTFYPPLRHFPNLHKMSGPTSGSRGAEVAGWKILKRLVRENGYTL